MKFNSKRYQEYIIKNILKSNELILACNYPFKNQSDWIIMEQLLYKSGCSFVRVKNKTFLKHINQTVFSNLKSTINGPILFIKLHDLKSFNFILTNFSIYFLKASDKLYNFRQLSCLNTLNYESNLSIFNYNLSSLCKRLPISLIKAGSKNLSE